MSEQTFQEKLGEILQRLTHEALDDTDIYRQQDLAQAAINELIKEEITKGRDIFLTTDDTDPILSEDYMANKAVKVRDTFRHELLAAFGLDSKVADSQPLDKEKE